MVWELLFFLLRAPCAKPPQTLSISNTAVCISRLHRFICVAFANVALLQNLNAERRKQKKRALHHTHSPSKNQKRNAKRLRAPSNPSPDHVAPTAADAATGGS